MMSFMRSFVKSPWAIGLFGLLIVGLVMTMGDPLQMGPIGGFVRSGERSIGARDVSRVVDQEIDRIRQEQNEIITQREAAERGLPQSIVQELTQQVSTLAYADKLGVRASPKAVAQIINTAPIFQNGLGAVDRDAVTRYANDQGMSLQEFEAFLQDSVTYDYLRQAALAGLKTPQILSRPIISFLGEKRTIDLGRMGPQSIPPVAAPDDAALRAFYTERQAMFAQPERRSISALAYTAEDFIDKVDVTPAQIKAEYDRRVREFSGPETREIAQFTSPEASKVQAVVDLVKQGRTLEAAAQATPGIELTTLTVRTGDITDKGYSDAVFGLPAGETYGPLPLAGAFAGVQIKSVTPGVATPFEQVSETLRTEIAGRDASRLYDDTSENFYDMVGGGATLEEISKEIGAPVIEYAAVDPRGGVEGGGQAGLLVRHADALTSMFKLQIGETSDIVEADGERVVMRLDGVTPARTPPFEEVKEELTPLYLAVKQVEAAEKVANDVVTAIKGGKSFTEAAAAAKIQEIKDQNLTRGSAQQIDPALVEAIFGIEAGGVAVARDSQGVPWVVKVTSVEPVGDNVDPQLLSQVDAQLLQSVTRDVGEAFARGVQREVKTRVNDKAISDYLAGFTQEAEQ